MIINLDEYHCSEYLEDYYANGLFHATECIEFLAHQDVTIEEESGFMKIGEVYDDHDMMLGYRRNLPGYWGCENRDGTFHFIGDTIHGEPEGWYQGNGTYWQEMCPEVQWLAISEYFRIQVERYHWDAGGIQYFIDYCMRSNQLMDRYIKAYKTTVGITRQNGFVKRSSENMVMVECKEGVYRVYYSGDFFDSGVKMEEFDVAGMPAVVGRIGEWLEGGKKIF